MRKTLSPLNVMVKCGALFFFTILFGHAKAALPSPVELLQEYLRIDTTNPPGNEMKAARFLEKIFIRYKIPVTVDDLGNGRANLMARLQGDGSRPAVILLHHMDVVPAERAFWKHDPFEGLIKDGEIIGRGSVDIKGKGIMDLLVMLKLKESGKKLKRDIIFLAVADEEMTSLGAKSFIKSHEEDLKKAQFVIDEGATARADKNGEPGLYYVSLGEKAPLWLTLTFEGKTGHASVPHNNNPVSKALLAGNRLLEFAHKEPLKVTPGTERYLELNAYGDFKKFPGFKKNFNDSLKNKSFLKALAKNPELNALLRNTVTVTGLHGSDKTNTIPNKASLNIDCRLLPGTDKDEFIKRLQKVIGIPFTYTIDEYYPSYFTSAKSDFLQALERTVGKGNVVSTILTSSTDSSLFRAKGLQVFGLEMYPLTTEIIETAHGNDERMPIKALHQGIETLTQLILELDKK